MRSKAIFYLCVIGGVYAAMEVLSLGVYSAAAGHAFSFEDIAVRQSARRVVAAEQVQGKDEAATALFNRQEFYPQFALNPYLGYTRNVTGEDLRLSPYGFYAEQDPIVASADKAVAIVGITGGSVAENMYVNDPARGILHHYLDKKFAPRKVVLAMLGMKGYAQPQQFIAVSHYLLLGGRLDMLVNLDGMNESYNYTDNQRRGLFPDYPWLWWGVFLNDFDPDSMAALGHMMMWREGQHTLADAFSHARFSVTASTLWSLLDGYFEAHMVRAELGLRKENAVPRYSTTGPDTMRRATPEALQEFKVKLWMQGSLQLYYLSQANHFAYFHFLQPNQYVADSKMLNEEEHKIAYVPNGVHGSAVIATYPQLLSHIAELREHGVNSQSLTGIYKDVTETIYVDNCCHVNAKGNTMLADAIGNAIAGAP